MPPLEPPLEPPRLTLAAQGCCKSLCANMPCCGTRPAGYKPWNEKRCCADNCAQCRFNNCVCASQTCCQCCCKDACMCAFLNRACADAATKLGPVRHLPGRVQGQL